MIRLVFKWLRDEDGASAAEFAMVLAPLLALLFGIIHLSLMMYSAQQLNFAAEATARCLVVSQNANTSSSQCPTTTAATTYFQALYKGPTAAPSLAQLDESPKCNTNSGTNTDYQVVATTNYVINAGFFSKTVPLTAKACFPHT